MLESIIPPPSCGPVARAPWQETCSKLLYHVLVHIMEARGTAREWPRYETYFLIDNSAVCSSVTGNRAENTRSEFASPSHRSQVQSPQHPESPARSLCAECAPDREAGQRRCATQPTGAGNPQAWD